MIERLARLPVDVDYASEYRYRNPIPDRNAMGLLITQSGETADTLAAQREMISLGSKTVAICNVVDAMVAREAHGAIYTHAGPEIGVASTKAFTAQLTALFLLALKLGQLRGRLDPARSVALIEELSRVPAKIEEVLRSRSAQCEQLAKDFSTARDFLYLGRGIHFPIALEGALKLKEISYIHAEGYPAGEMKHGPNALIDETLPVVVLATDVYKRQLLHRKEQPLHVHVEGLIKMGLSSHRERCHCTRARVCEEYVDVTMFLFHDGIEPVQIFQARHVACDRRNVSPDKGCSFFKLFLSSPSDHDVRTFFHEALGRGQANPCLLYTSPTRRR